jgi:hypothetical protein
MVVVTITPRRSGAANRGRAGYNPGMTDSEPPKPTAGRASDFAEVPGFARAIRHLAHVPKPAVDTAIAKDRRKRKRQAKRKG